MSSSTNGQLRQPVTPNSFNRTSNPYLISKTARPKSTAAKKPRRSTVRPHHSMINEQHQHQQQQQLDDIPLDSSTPTLQGIVIYIDKSVMNRDGLTGMANALAATVLDKWTHSVTHLIHGSIAQPPSQQRQQPPNQNSSSKRHQGHRIPSIITKSLEKKMRVVAPAWLTACYNNKERMPESLYPYEMDSHHRMASLRHDSSMDSAMEENPFGLEPDEFATVASCDDEPVTTDRRVTDYFQRTTTTTTNNNNNNNNNNSRSEDTSTHDDQQGDLYNDTDHLDFDDADNFNNDEVINGGDNGKHSNINKDSTNDDDNDDHATGISYSLIEMSQVQPPPPQQSIDIPQALPRQQQSTSKGACAYEGSSTGENQLNKVDSFRSLIAASVERSIQQMMAMDEGSQTALCNDSRSQKPSVKIDEDYGDYGTYEVDDDDASLSALPDLDPSRQPKVTLGREDRLQIWYGEQSFCLDAGVPLSRKRNEFVDLTSSTIPPQDNNGQSSANKPHAPSTSKLTTSKSPITTKRLKRSYK